jgi:hypothetical protein
MIRHFVSSFTFGHRMVGQVECALMFLAWIDDLHLSTLYVVQHECSIRDTGSRSTLALFPVI